MSGTASIGRRAKAQAPIKVAMAVTSSTNQRRATAKLTMEAIMSVPPMLGFALGEFRLEGEAAFARELLAARQAGDRGRAADARGHGDRYGAEALFRADKDARPALDG